MNCLRNIVTSVATSFLSEQFPELWLCICTARCLRPAFIVCSRIQLDRIDCLRLAASLAADRCVVPSKDSMHF